MQRLANFDISNRFGRAGSKLAVQLAFGFACSLTMIGVRSGLDQVAPLSGPFALVYPTVLIATLYGHWQAGITAYLTSFLWAWRYVLPQVNSFNFEVATDPPRVIINAVAVAIVLFLAEAFRRAVDITTQARDAEIERRGLLLAELDHRTKNNFALVVSLLELQRRRAHDAETKAALGEALNRVHTFAKAYTHLADSQGEGDLVAMRAYLKQVAGGAGEAMFGDGVHVAITVDDCILPRQTAVAIGLFVNEALTNCAKYAFPDGRGGHVTVTFECKCAGEDWLLTVSDDGIGETNSTEPRSMDSVGSGLGSSLMQAFAHQAEAQIVSGKAAKGWSIGLRSGRE